MDNKTLSRMSPASLPTLCKMENERKCFFVDFLIVEVIYLATLNSLLPSCRELNPVGSRALSHDSIFIPEDADPCRDCTMSQENVSDKVRNLQVILVSALSGWPRGFIRP